VAVPKVSIVIPFLNMGRFLPDSITSILAQTFEDWELLIVDDGSKPEEYSIAQTQRDRDPARIRVLAAKAEPSGASAARNRGIREASGEYLALLDADDLWHPDKLAHQVGILESFPEAVMTFARVRYFWDDRPPQAEFDQPFEPLRKGIYNPPDILPVFYRHNEVYPCPSATLIRLQDFRDIGGFEDRFRKIRTDLAAWTKLATHGPVYADDFIGGRYRQHAGSSVAESAQQGLAFAYDRKFFEWALAYVETIPAPVRRALEPVLCEKMLYYSVQDALSRGFRSSLGWRWDVGRRLVRYPAFRRRGRLFRALVLKEKSFEGRSP
jgi:glycosyltransferase involved in cell wall biosynthesis